MKKLFVSFLLFLLVVEAFPQMVAKEAGIGIQGIARDANFNARSNQDITLRFSLYYLNENNSEIQVFNPVSENLRTDAFGVFSYVLVVEPQYHPIIAYYEIFLKIEEGTTVISEEKLKQVPYAISAGNGVPTGSIMPFAGATAPPGWVLCHGQDISNVAGSASLRNLLGKATVPDLRGMFLRGTGTNPEYQKEGPELLASQEDMIATHNHSAGELEATGGEHQHNIRSDGTGDASGIYRTVVYARTFGGNMTNFFTQMDGAHTHQIDGNTADTGGEETRPINVGVNYIIKL